MIRYLIVGCCLFCLVSCRPKSFSEKDMYIFLQEEKNGYTKSKIVNGVQIKVTARPVDLVALQDAKRESNVQQRKLKFDASKKEFSHFCYFVLSLSMDEKEITTQQITNQAELSQRVINMSYGMKDNVFITTTKNDTLFATDYVFERTYGLGASSNFLFVFDRKELLKQPDFQFNVLDIGLGTGNNKFFFDAAIFKKEPLIDLTKIAISNP